MLENDARLIEAKIVAQHIVGAQQIHAAYGSIKIVGIISVETDIDSGVVQKIQFFAVPGVSAGTGA